VSTLLLIPEISSGTSALIGLNGVEIDFEGTSAWIPASSSAAVTIGDNQPLDVASGVLGSFGHGDFSIELTYQGTGDDLSPHGGYALLFAREMEDASNVANTLLYVFVYDSGKLHFRTGETGAANNLECDNALPTPTSTQARKLRFESSGGRLSISVDGVEMCSQTVASVQQLAPNWSSSTSRLRIGGHPGGGNGQNLVAILSNIRLATPSYTPPLLRLNGLEIDFADTSDPIPPSGSAFVVMKDNQHLQLESSFLGSFGYGDFSIEFTYRGNGVDLIPDNGASTLFQRLMGDWDAGHKIMAWVNKDGKFEFRVDAHYLECDDALPTPSSTQARELRFERSGGRISISVDGNETCSQINAEPTGVPDWSSSLSYLRFGAHTNPDADSQNLNSAILSNIRLVNPIPAITCNDAVGHGDRGDGHGVAKSALIPGTLVDCEEVRASLNAKLEVALYSGAAQNSYGGGLRTTCEQFGVHGHILVVPGTLSDCQAVRDQLNGLVDGTLFGCNDDYLGEGDSTPNINSGIKFLGTCVDPTLAVAVDAMNCLTGAKTDCVSYVYEFFVAVQGDNVLGLSLSEVEIDGRRPLGIEMQLNTKLPFRHVVKPGLMRTMATKETE